MAVAERQGVAETHLVFRVGEVLLAVPALSVQSVVDAQTPRPLPLTPPHVPGVVNQGERALVLFDPGRFLQLPRGNADASSIQRVLVLEAAGMRVGLLCDRVLGLREVGTPGRRAPEVLSGAQLRRFLSAEFELETGVVGVLDLDELLKAARVSA